MEEREERKVIQCYICNTNLLEIWEKDPATGEWVVVCPVCGTILKRKKELTDFNKGGEKDDRKREDSDDIR